MSDTTYSKDVLENYFNDPESMPETYDEEAEYYLFPNGMANGQCTQWMAHVRRLLGPAAEMTSYLNRNNPGAEAAPVPRGHDFAVVDGRYVVDPWIVHVAGRSETSVFDLTDPADAAEIKRLYGIPALWEVDPFGWKKRLDRETVEERAAAIFGFRPFPHGAAIPTASPDDESFEAPFP